MKMLGNSASPDLGMRLHSLARTPRPIIMYQPKGAASLAASYVNIANPGTYNATPMDGAPVFDTATGWTFQAPDYPYLKTGLIIPSGKRYSFVVRFSDWSSYMFGQSTFNTNIYIIANDGKGFSYFCNVGNECPGQQSAVPTGVIALTSRIFLNGSQILAPNSFDNIVYDQIFEIYVGATNSQDSQVYKGTGTLSAFVVYNTLLSDSQAAKISSVVAAL